MTRCKRNNPGEKLVKTLSFTDETAVVPGRIGKEPRNYETDIEQIQTVSEQNKNEMMVTRRQTQEIKINVDILSLIRNYEILKQQTDIRWKMQG